MNPLSLNTTISHSGPTHQPLELFLPHLRVPAQNGALIRTRPITALPSTACARKRIDSNTGAHTHTHGGSRFFWHTGELSVIVFLLKATLALHLVRVMGTGKQLVRRELISSWRRV